MKLKETDLFLLCQCAISAAYQAGNLISEYAGKQLDIKTKADGRSIASQVVTEVDLLSQELILKTLLPTCEIYDIAMLAEEETDDKSRFEKDYFWCIDPLDGTLPFTESIPGYAVSIALVSKTGTSQIGVVFDPVTKTLYHAIKGKGAFRNGNSLNINRQKQASTEVVNVFFDRSFFSGTLFETTKTELDKLQKELGFKELKIAQVGGSVMSAIQVIEKMPACYFKYPREKDSGGSLWDYAATSCIFNELEKPSFDIFGNPLDLNREGSTFMNHKGFVYASDANIAEMVMMLYRQLKKKDFQKY